MTSAMESREIGRAAAGAPFSVGRTELERPHLSAREREVLRVWLYSDSKREIAAQLHLSVGTVNTYLTRVRGKYAAIGRPAKTKSALMARALQDGIVRIDEF